MPPQGGLSVLRGALGVRSSLRLARLSRLQDKHSGGTERRGAYQVTLRIQYDKHSREEDHSRQNQIRVPFGQGLPTSVHSGGRRANRK